MYIQSFVLSSACIELYEMQCFSEHVHLSILHLFILKVKV